MRNLLSLQLFIYLTMNVLVYAALCFTCLLLNISSMAATGRLILPRIDLRREGRCRAEDWRTEMDFLLICVLSIQMSFAEDTLPPHLPIFVSTRELVNRKNVGILLSIYRANSFWPLKNENYTLYIICTQELNKQNKTTTKITWNITGKKMSY